MKSFLRHLNQALYDTNQFFWRELIKPWLTYFAFTILFLAFTILPVMYVDNETFFVFWPVFSIIFCSFWLVTYLIYVSSREYDVMESEVVFESEINGFSIVKELKEPVPLTLKESVRQGLRWTWHLCIIIGTALLLMVIWGELTE